MLRPPTRATCPSTVKELLCIRRLMRRKIQQVGRHARAAQDDGVEQPDLDIGMQVQLGQFRFDIGHAVVVEQQAHAHATVGRPFHRVQQQHPGEGLRPDVIARIEAVFGHVGQLQQPGKGAEAVLQVGHARQARMRGGKRQDQRPQRAALARRDCLSVDPVFRLGHPEDRPKVALGDQINGQQRRQITKDGTQVEFAALGPFPSDDSVRPFT